MSSNTPIEWADSTVNPVMGCDGCELWMPEAKVPVKKCYAGQLHVIRAGRPGYADEFTVPKMFPGRTATMARTRSLVGTARPDKPWFGTGPRVIFVSDMGDALSRGVPFDFLRREIVDVADSERGLRHTWMWLTKQPHRMAEFAESLGGLRWPPNLWAGTSLTEPKYLPRVEHLRRVPAPLRFLSVEPLVADVGRLNLDGIGLVIVGGESGPGARALNVSWVRSLVAQCRAAGVAVFVKQLGAHVITRNDDGLSGGDPDDWQLADPEAQVEHDLDGTRDGYQGAPVRIHLRDRKGGDMTEWPKDLRVRQWPEVSR